MRGKHDVANLNSQASRPDYGARLETCKSRLMPETPEEYVFVFEYVRETACTRFITGNVHNPTSTCAQSNRTQQQRIHHPAEETRPPAAIRSTNDSDRTNRPLQYVHPSNTPPAHTHTHTHSPRYLAVHSPLTGARLSPHRQRNLSSSRSFTQLVNCSELQSLWAVHSRPFAAGHAKQRYGIGSRARRCEKRECIINCPKI